MLPQQGEEESRREAEARLREALTGANAEHFKSWLMVLKVRRAALVAEDLAFQVVPDGFEGREAVWVFCPWTRRRLFVVVHDVDGHGAVGCCCRRWFCFPPDVLLPETAVWASDNGRVVFSHIAALLDDMKASVRRRRS